jgi:hypothetical protein
MPSPKALHALLVVAALIFANGVTEATPVHPQIQAEVIRTIEQRRSDPRYGTRRKEAMALFGIGLTRMMAIEAAGEVQTYLDGASRMITLDSVVIRQIALLLLAHPLSGAAPKARLPAARYQKRRREPTPQELEGLRIGNERREEARRLREAKTPRV